VPREAFGPSSSPRRSARITRFSSRVVIPAHTVRPMSDDRGATSTSSTPSVALKSVPVSIVTA
jgi:hypothetical protein